METSSPDQSHLSLAICHVSAICKIKLETSIICSTQYLYLSYEGLQFSRQLNDNYLVGNIPPELGKLEQLFEL